MDNRGARAARPRASRPTDDNGDSGQGKPRLLILEDEAPARKYLAMELRKEGFEVLAVKAGIEAIQKAEDPTIQLVLLDIRVPGRYNGVETAHRILQMHPDKAVIFVTAHTRNNEAYKQRAAELGLQKIQWAIKPSTEGQWKELLAMIQRTLEKRRIQQFVKGGEAEGIRLQPLLRLLRRWDPRVPRDLVDEVLRENRPALISELGSGLAEVRASLEESPPDFRIVQTAFGPFKQAVIGKVWNVFEEADEQHQRIASYLEMAVRNLSAFDLELKHVEALEILLRKLEQAKLAPEEVRECKRSLRHHGIETLIDFGKHRQPILESYRDEDSGKLEGREEANR